MVVKTITVTQDAYETLKRAKHADESFSEVILRVVPRKATAADWFGICPGTEQELKKELRELKKRREAVSKEFKKRRAKYVLS